MFSSVGRRKHKAYGLKREKETKKNCGICINNESLIKKQQQKESKKKKPSNVALIRDCLQVFRPKILMKLTKRKEELTA